MTMNDASELVDDALFRSIELSPIASVITNPREIDNPIVAANRAFCDLTGYVLPEVLGRNCRFLAGTETEPQAQVILRSAVASGQAALAEMTNYRKDGSRFRNAVMIAPVLDRNGAIAYFVGSQMEIEEGNRRRSPRVEQAEKLVRSLSPRQHQVLRGMLTGFRNKQIAAMLGIDETTVKMHRAGLLAKLDVSTSADAIRIGVEAGLHLSDHDL